MGKDRLDAASHTWEAGGDMTGAAWLSWIGYLLYERGVISMKVGNDFAFRAADLLATNDDPDAKDLEIEVLNKLSMSDIGSERNKRALARLNEVVASQAATYESKLGEAAARCMEAFALAGMLGQLDPRYADRCFSVGFCRLGALGMLARSSLQTTISMSTCESELTACSYCSRNILGLINVLTGISRC